jgi:methylated-DNA-[protein]-cysteine S-methyltransferase
VSELTLDGPFGPLTLTQEAGEITRLRWGGAEHGAPTRLLAEAALQLSEYFASCRTVFDLPLRLGSGFQARFLKALIEIPFGETRSYGDLAHALGVSPQAIGQACGANPIPILVPCHRVLGADGLGGYSAPGGIETKVALLRHEGAASLLL